MNADDRSMRRKSADDVARPLVLHDLAHAAPGQRPEVVSLPQHGLIPLEQLRRLYAVELDALADEARRAGYEEGSVQASREAAEAVMRAEEARRRAQEAADALLSERLKMLETLAASMQAERRELVRSAEAEMVELSFACLTGLLGSMAADAGLIRALIANAIAKLPGDEPLAVRIAIEDHARLVGCGMQPGTTEGRSVRFIADAGLSAGDCRVESGRGTLDAGLGTQLEKLKQLLVTAHAAGAS